MDVPGLGRGDPRRSGAGSTLVVAVDGRHACSAARRWAPTVRRRVPTSARRRSWSARRPAGAASAGRWGSTSWSGTAPTASAAIQFNAVVSTNTGAVRLWQSLGFEIDRHRARGLPAARSGDVRRPARDVPRAGETDEDRRDPPLPGQGDGRRVAASRCDVDARGLDGRPLVRRRGRRGQAGDRARTAGGSVGRDEIFEYRRGRSADGDTRVDGPSAAPGWSGDAELDRSLSEHLGAEVRDAAPRPARPTRTPARSRSSARPRSTGAASTSTSTGIARRIRPNLVVEHHRAVRGGDVGRRHDPGRRGRADGGRAHRAVPDGRHRPGRPRRAARLAQGAGSRARPVPRASTPTSRTGRQRGRR